MLIDESLPVDLAAELPGHVVVVARVRNRIEDLRPLIPEILDVLSRLRPGEVVEIHGRYER